MKNDTEILLSICICTLPERKKIFDGLFSKLKNQILNTFLLPNNYEILYDATERGLITIGAKRNKLRNYAKGKYICFIDDDDTISGNYIDLITEAMMYNADIITFGIDNYFNGRYQSTTFINRFLDEQNKETTNFLTTENIGLRPNHIFYHAGSQYHLTPVKMEISLQIPFIDANNNEDHEYSEGIKRFLQSEFHIGHVLYLIKQNVNQSE